VRWTEQTQIHALYRLKSSHIGLVKQRVKDMSFKDFYYGEKLIRKIQEDEILYAEYVNITGLLRHYVLEFSQMHLKYFTSHGVLHIGNVIDQLSAMIPDAILAKMNSLELFVLLCSAWLHDIGMLINRDSKGNILAEQEIRENHHVLTRDFIRENYNKLGIHDAVTAQVIADICYCHRREVDIKTYLPTETKIVGTVQVRTRLLAALLRLADALDVTSKRSPEVIFKDLAYLPELSEKHWRACQLVHGIEYNAEKLAITLDTTYNNADEYELLLWKFRDIFQEFYSIRDVLIENGVNYAIIQLRLLDIERRTVVTIDGEGFFGTPIFPSWKELRKSAEIRVRSTLHGGLRA
jgi:hypothetical protein